MQEKTVYLATTGIDEIWDRQGKIVFIGPWCLDYLNAKPYDVREPVVIKNEKYFNKNIIDTAVFCEKVYFSIIEELAGCLNRAHNVNKDARFWSVILSPWLLCHVFMVYDRYLRIKEALRTAGRGFYTHSVDFTSGAAAIDSVDFFSNKINSDYYNLQLISCINSMLGIKLDKKDILVEECRHPDSKSVKDAVKLLFKKSILRIQRLFLKDGLIVMSDMYRMNFWDIIVFNMKFKQMLSIEFDLQDFKQFIPAYSPEMRSNLGLESETTDEFLSILKKTIPYFIPRYCVEGFSYFNNRALKYKRNTPKLVISAVGWHINEKFKFYAALMQEKGARLAGVQHGGDYGFIAYEPFLSFELKSKNKFISWGWNNEADKLKIIPLPDPKLSKIMDSKRKSKDYMLFISFNYQRYPYSLVSYPGVDNMGQYFDKQALFLSSLPEDLKAKLYYRPYPDSFGKNILNKVKESCPNVKLANEGKCLNWMRSARLTIIDHPITTIVEALVMDIPLVMFWDEGLWLIKDEAKPYFEMLKEAGVLYSEGVAAAAGAARIYGRAEAWWRQKNIQEARKAFIGIYGSSDRNWREIWVTKLASII